MPKRVPTPTDQIQDEFPSTRWDTVDWVNALHVDDALYARLLDGVAGISARWRVATDDGRRKLARNSAIFQANVRADRELGIPTQRKNLRSQGER